MKMIWKIKILISSLALFSSGLIAQNQVYILHPTVGDTISRIEKLDYSLFPKTDNPNFNKAYISFKNDSFFLNSIYDSYKLVSRYLPREEIIEAQKGIEKINAYYRYLADTTRNENTYRPSSLSTKIEMNSSSLTEQAKKEARMYNRLKEDQRRAKEVGRGNNNPQEIRIEFK